MLSHYIHINHNNDRTLQDQIKGSIAKAIFDGFIPKENSLISSRKLAQDLSVSRNTILRVYEQLTEDGILVSVERKGYFVNPNLEIAAPTASGTKPYVHTALDWSRYLNTEHITSAYTAKDLKHYKYLFVGGAVDEDLFPVIEWRKCSIQSLNRTNHQSWTSNNSDYHDLIEQIRTRVLPKRGIFVNADQIAITHGCQNSLYYLSKLLINKKTTVAIEDPCYPEALHQFQAQKAKILPIEVDEQGMTIDERLQNAQIIYSTPSNQFPTTVRLSPERRKELIRSAEKHDFLIIEDDFEHDVNFMENTSPPLKGEYPSDRIIYISSFTSTIAPGLRIGYIVSAPPLIAQIKRMQLRSHSLPPKNNCQTLALFLNLGYYDALMQKMLKRYREKWLTIEKAMNHYFPQSGVTPSLAGTAFWINYKEGFDSEKLERLAEQHGILINSGSQYYYDRKHSNSFRLSFQSIKNDNIREGIALLSRLAKTIMPIERLDECQTAPLDGKAIRELLTGKTMLTKDCFNIPYRITYQPDGKMTGLSDRPNDTDEGYWWIENNKLMYQWRNWQFADIRRITVVIDDDKLKRFDEEGFYIGDATLIV
ncbi:MocR-like pyridoxine biosynthesis transcription factor PdxR [Vibrio salinus]|uniref:MocR-like pyridoxine biosynthesis transcription factor PdxR n=1 Tax=Vibrio salinus TaxID=2899784 RepID=UPI001E5CB1EE|nr:PLP-dependent aminotransferase family protein [Vibrio salinus]MCE0494093.1 PLP-dependent aminotransferase family protein [Vibrio salinus]